MNCQLQFQQREARGRRRLSARRERRGEERLEKFAGPKWNAAPAACALPRPPTDWLAGPPPDHHAMTLKLLLNVSASA